MKHFLAIVITSTVFCPFAFGMMGGASTGGGQGIVCRDDDGNIQSAEMLDLFEARNYFGLQLQNQGKRPYLDIAHDYATTLDSGVPGGLPMGAWSDSAGGVVTQSGYELNPGLVLDHLNGAKFIRDAVDAIEKGKMLVPGHAIIPPIGDSHPLVLPGKRGCRLEQIAVYTDGDDKVHIRQAVWDKMSNVNKAGLLIHEALYHSLRQMGDTTSDQTRKVVGYAFSGLPFTWVLEGLPEKFLSCWTADSAFQFLIFATTDKWVTARFLMYDGQVVMRRTETYFNVAPFAKQLGLPQSVMGQLTISDTIKDPLIDLPNYTISYRTDAVGNVTASFEADSGVAGKNQREILCNPHMSRVVISKTSSGYSVEVGPAN